MKEFPFLRLLRGPFSFLRPDSDELGRVLPEWSEVLPQPQRIFLEREEATPVLGFPVLMSEGIRELRDSLEAWIRAEEEDQVQALRKEPRDQKTRDAARARYLSLLAEATTNAVGSSFGRRYPSIFWLYHSIAVSRVFKETPQRLRRLDLALGRSEGESLKYRIFHSYLDRVLSVTYDVVQRASQESEEDEKELFPAVLARMRDNVLILTEDHISPDLAELGAYFRGHLRLDGKEFRARMEALSGWHDEEIERDPDLEAAVRHLTGSSLGTGARDLLKSPGYASFLARRPSYDGERYLSDRWLGIWEGLLLRLKEFELLVALRRYVIPVYRDGERLQCAAATLPRSSGGKSVIYLSPSTRPLDFLTPWVVDPRVQRFGLVYDITDFSSILSVVRRSGSPVQEDSVRRMFAFQRRVNRMAREHRLQLEKYLGDGALYSGRHPTRLLVAAIEMQRFYRQALEEGFPFDRGMRIALNYGRYRLLPIEGGAGGIGHRYEFFGHGIVELTRLVTGKTMREIEDIKNLLVSRGYPPQDVDRFFAPMSRQNISLVERGRRDRAFYAYINPSGALINEGIVATEPFVTQIDASEAIPALKRAADGPRRFVTFEIDEGSGPVTIGLRKLGFAKLKGLGSVAIYEVVDGEAWRDAPLETLEEATLLSALEREFALATSQAREGREGSVR